MSTHKSIDRICVAAVILSLLLMAVFVNGAALGLQTAGDVMEYEKRLFDTSAVHTIEITMDDWDGFIQTCESEAYSVCSVVIDGESCHHVGIRAKGNTSLSSVSGMGSDRYSFKIEFDQYDSAKSYHGLDKLCLNNLIQDNTYMKDYLVYQMMGEFGVDAPLCSYVYLTVNGEDWGLYLAVEGVEEAFLQRNYGSDYGELYQPDSLSLGGGRGNGREFDISDFQKPEAGANGDTDWNGGQTGSGPGGVEPPETGQMSSAPASGLSGGFHSGNASDVKLQYIDDEPASYSNLFDNAKTELSDADQRRLIASLKSLSSYENLERVLNIDEVLRYFVVHNFVVNDDSYTGSMIHNYYLYEEDGRLSMIPWDYNLAFGTFSGDSATSSVNEAIDDVLSDRPMQAWIFSDGIYSQMYHALYAEFLSTVDVSGMIEETCALIAPYVEKDPGKFCTYEEFEVGVQVLKDFCRLREESVRGQLDGTIPSTSEEQNSGAAALVDAGNLELSAMGTMTGGGNPQWESFSGQESNQQSSQAQTEPPSHDSTGASDTGQAYGGEPPPDGAEPPQGFEASSALSGNGQIAMDGGTMGAAPEGPPGDRGVSDGSSGASVCLTVVSILFLLGGLAFAYKFRR